MLGGIFGAPECRRSHLPRCRFLAVLVVFGRDNLAPVSHVILIVPFEPRLAEGVATVCSELGWPSYADAAVAARGCGAPGVSTFVAVADRAVIGFARVLSDGVVQAYLALIGVLEPWRRQGIARRLGVQRSKPPERSGWIC